MTFLPIIEPAGIALPRSAGEVFSVTQPEGIKRTPVDRRPLAEMRQEIEKLEAELVEMARVDATGSDQYRLVQQRIGQIKANVRSREMIAAERARLRLALEDYKTQIADIELKAHSIKQQMKLHESDTDQYRILYASLVPLAMTFQHLQSAEQDDRATLAGLDAHVKMRRYPD